MMREVISYALVFSDTDQEFVNDVNQMIQDGYQPYGSAVTGRVGIYQPMVKYAEPAIYLDHCGNRIG